MLQPMTTDDLDEIQQRVSRANIDHAHYANDEECTLLPDVAWAHVAYFVDRTEWLVDEVRRLREENERLRSFRVVIGTIREATPSAGEVDDAEDMD